MQAHRAFGAWTLGLVPVAACLRAGIFSPALDQKLLDIHSFRLYSYQNTRFKKKGDLGRRDARMVTREEHLARCKQGAIARLDAGDVTGAIASMISDLRKVGRPPVRCDSVAGAPRRGPGPSHHAGRSPGLDQQLQLMCRFTGLAFECRHVCPALPTEDPALCHEHWRHVQTYDHPFAPRAIAMILVRNTPRIVTITPSLISSGCNRAPSHSRKMAKASPQTAAISG